MGDGLRPRADIDLDARMEPLVRRIAGTLDER